ncbi:hypothetical protein EYZ11_005184 [Aspergillus tanneri]|uniref:ditrans,polycis-polyprenyl diphosphate synthase [(2E,6E)-farnesyldiphosphate specific] n=1 Tax=Aspergillus tanneri TaxID=1220188 RepID=A0A4V3UPI7_9EURO|nr:hypothetical protein EYZ11_005184 [Aspergillus tanneri]
MLSTVDLSEEKVEQVLHQKAGHSPDFLVVWGKRLTLKGYPPWQLHLPEIYLFSSPGGFRNSFFLDALNRYAHANLRKGL